VTDGLSYETLATPVTNVPKSDVVGGRSMAKIHGHTWHLRHALQLTAQLPENKSDARAILAIVAEFVENYWDDPAALANQSGDCESGSLIHLRRPK
jgi:hypothetical protein